MGPFLTHTTDYKLNSDKVYLAINLNASFLKLHHGLFLDSGQLFMVGKFHFQPLIEFIYMSKSFKAIKWGMQRKARKNNGPEVSIFLIFNMYVTF